MNSKLRKIMDKLYFLALIVLISSCSHNSLDIEEVSENTEFTLTSSLKAHIPVTLTTRTTNEAPIKSLRLLVFDHENNFLYSRIAILDEFNENTKSINYTVTLIKSPQKRVIHYIANYDWTGFKQDYFLTGINAGSIIGGLNTKHKTYWQILSLDKLDEQSLKNQQLTLINSMSMINVSYLSDNPDFKLLGYKVYNSYDRGTIAPFTADQMGQVHFTTNVLDIAPTLPTGYKIKNEGDLTNLDPIEVFERKAIQDNNSIFVLIKGKYLEHTYYYKVDLKQVNPETGVTTLLDILRNRLYQVNIESVEGPGFNDEESAKIAPAGNNLFASIELEEYGMVSNGIESLTISKLTEIIVNHPSVFETTVSYSGGSENVRYYPSWQAEDEYLGGLVTTPIGTITVPIKNIPTDRTLEYTIDVVAKAPDGANRIITRQIKLILESPYDLDPHFIVQDNNKISVDFIISEKLDNSAYPLDIFITSTNLSPIYSTGSITPTIAFIDGGYSFKYTFREKPINKHQTFYFKKNIASVDSPIYITGKYFKKEGAIQQME